MKNLGLLNKPLILLLYQPSLTKFSTIRNTDNNNNTVKPLNLN